MYKHETLESLYQKISETQFLKSMTEGTIGFLQISKQINKSIEMTLSLSTFPNIKMLFYLIGCFPAGIAFEDFDIIWKEYVSPQYDEMSVSSISVDAHDEDDPKDWIEGLSFLENSSLVFIDGKFIQIAPVVRSVCVKEDFYPKKIRKQIRELV